MARLVAAALLALLVGLALYVTWPGRRAPVIGRGIPQALADDRAERIRNLTYAATFDIPVERTAPIRGSLTATFTLSHVKGPLAFDFTQPPEKFLGARINGTVSTRVIAADGHLIVPAGELLPGRTNTITIDFVAGDEALTV